MHTSLKRLFACSAAALSAVGVLSVPVSAGATPVPGSSCYVSNPKSIFYIPWSNGGGGIGCYSIDQSGRIYQKTYGSSAPPSEIKGNGNADYFYTGFWQSSTIRRICVVKDNKGYYDSYVLGSGWKGWTPTSDLNSSCPEFS